MGRTLSLILLLTLALPMPGVAQQLPTLPGRATPDAADDVSIYVLIGQSRRLPDNRIEVKTRSGTWMQFPPDGIWWSGKLILYNGIPSLDLRLPRTRLEEIRRIIEDEMPPHKWGRIEPWQCAVDCGDARAGKF